MSSIQSTDSRRARQAEETAAQPEAKIMRFQEITDGRGSLVVVEDLKDIPFRIARIFYIYGTDTEAVRGCHANRKTEFVLINVCGSSKVKAMNGRTEEVYVLDKPSVGVYLPKMVWKEMYDFSADSVLLCLCSENYDPGEYIRDYKAFLKEVRCL